jgi:hypothetical protein
MLQSIEREWQRGRKVAGVEFLFHRSGRTTGGQLARAKALFRWYGGAPPRVRTCLAGIICECLGIQAVKRTYYRSDFPFVSVHVSAHFDLPWALGGAAPRKYAGCEYEDTPVSLGGRGGRAFGYAHAFAETGRGTQDATSGAGAAPGPDASVAESDTNAQPAEAGTDSGGGSSSGDDGGGGEGDDDSEPNEPSRGWPRDGGSGHVGGLPGRIRTGLTSLIILLQLYVLHEMIGQGSAPTAVAAVTALMIGQLVLLGRIVAPRPEGEQPG